MERYDYLEAVKEDVLNYINENNIVVTILRTSNRRGNQFYKRL